MQSNEIKAKKPPSHLRKFLNKFKTYVNLADENNDDGNDEKKAPIVFCYSLFYVYYDQYTYITGVLTQDVLLGIITVFISI